VAAFLLIVAFALRPAISILISMLGCINSTLPFIPYISPTPLHPSLSPPFFMTSSQPPFFVALLSAICEFCYALAELRQITWQAYSTTTTINNNNNNNHNNNNNNNNISYNNSQQTRHINENYYKNKCK